MSHPSFRNSQARRTCTNLEHAPAMSYYCKASSIPLLSVTVNKKYIPVVYTLLSHELSHLFPKMIQFDWMENSAAHSIHCCFSCLLSIYAGKKPHMDRWRRSSHIHTCLHWFHVRPLCHSYCWIVLFHHTITTWPGPCLWVSAEWWIQTDIIAAIPSILLSVWYTIS